MAEINLTFDNQVALRIKSAYISYFNLDEDISNNDLLVFIKSDLKKYIKEIVKSIEKRSVVEEASQQVDDSIENEVIID